MLKKSKLILIILFVSGCSSFKNETSSTIFKPYVEQYLNVFIEENEGINPENYFIEVITKILGDGDYILTIRSAMHENIYFIGDSYRDTIYSCNYKGFMVLAFDNNKIVIEDAKYKNVFIPPSSEGHIPISYNGIHWELKIEVLKLIDFSYQFCEPGIEVFDRLRSTPISNDTENPSPSLVPPHSSSFERSGNEDASKTKNTLKQ